MLLQPLPKLFFTMKDILRRIPIISVLTTPVLHPGFPMPLADSYQTKLQLATTDIQLHYYGSSP
jgi:hypothetical protein